MDVRPHLNPPGREGFAQTQPARKRDSASDICIRTTEAYVMVRLMEMCSSLKVKKCKSASVIINP
jgi:hypothetical protein